MDGVGRGWQATNSFPRVAALISFLASWVEQVGDCQAVIVKPISTVRAQLERYVPQLRCCCFIHSPVVSLMLIVSLSNLDLNPFF